MSDRPTTGDREQQRADNVASRRQSGLEPLPRDRAKAGGEKRVEEHGSGEESERAAEENGVRKATEDGE